MQIAKSRRSKIAKWSMVIAGLVVASAATETSVNAHHPFLRHHSHFGYRHFGYGYYGGFGSYGLGYTSFYSGFAYRPFLHRSYSVGFYNYGSPWYYPSFYPTYYPVVPVYAVPSYYCSPYASLPTTNYYDPPTSVLVGTVDPGLVARNSFASPSKVASAGNLGKNAPIMMDRALLTSTVKLASAVQRKPELDTASPVMPDLYSDPVSFADLDLKLVAKRPSLLQPYSPIWTKAAVGIVDDMVEAGQFVDAYTSCKSMEKIEQPKGAGVYLRQALMSYFTNDSNDASKLERVLALLDQACASGSQLIPSELSKESLRDYFSACSVNVDRSLENLSKKILDNPSVSGNELLLLTALLKLDGQSDRAQLFAHEAEQVSSQSKSFKWDNVLSACMR